jgi:FHIPEP family
LAGVDEAAVALPKEQLELVVELGPDVAGFGDSGSVDGAEFRDSLLQHVSELFGDLGLPVDPRVSIDTLPAESDVLGPYRIRVAGRHCAPALPVAAGQDLTPERLAGDVAGVIARNRELCVTPGSAEHLRQGWEAANPGVAHMTPGALGFDVVLTELLRRCVSVAPRAIGEEAFGDGAGPSQLRASSPERVWEAVIAARGVVSLRVLVGPDLTAAAAADPQSDSRPYSSDVSLSLARRTLADLFHEELGVLIPPVRFDVDPALGNGRFRIEINDLRFPPLEGLLADEVMVNAELAALGPLGTGGHVRAHPTHGTEAAVVRLDNDGLATLNAQGHATWGPQGYVVFSLAREIRRHAGALLLADVVTFHLDRLRPQYPFVVDTALQRFDRYRITAVLRRLLDDQVSIHDLGGILEGMLAVDGGVAVDQSRYRLITPNGASLWPVQEAAELSAPGVDEYAECVRRHLRGQLTSMHTGGGNWLKTIAVDERLEARLRHSVAQPLDEGERDQLRGSVWGAYESFARSGVPPVVVTNSEVRRFLRGLLEKEFPFLPVVSLQELAPGTQVQSVNRIVWARGPAKEV